MEVLNLLCAPVTEVVKSWIDDHIGYIFHYKRNTEDLNTEVEKLGTMRNDVEDLVKTARRRGDPIKQVVEGWLASVDNVRHDAARLNDEVEQINNSWVKGWWCSRHDVGKEAKEKIGTVEKLLNEGRNFSTTTNVSIPAPPPSIESIPSSSSTGDFHDFESTKSATRQIIEALKDENVNIIGVWGMPGVGKTTLIKEIGKKVKRDELFDEVVLVTVSQNPVLTKIQGEIAEKLGMKLEEDSEDVRAGRLCARLKKRVLVILDDVWDRLELADLGISFEDHDHNHCRVLLTTRSRDVCNHMEAHKIIELQVLSKQDSWNLFRQKAGNVVDSPGLQTLATEVAAECGGLPLAIVTLGRALRGKKQKPLWEDALRQLKRSIYEGMMSRVFASIKLSYDFLEREETKKCFLYCCFFPEDFTISGSDLMPYVMGDDLLEDVYTLEEAKARLETLFDMLIASCLLVKVDDEDGFLVMMHDVVRDVALSIAFKESNFGFIVKAGMGLTRWPHEENLGTCVRLSLMRNQITELPDQPPECQQLLTLSLSDNSSFKKFPGSFFSRMTSLVTLDLMRTEILSLPPSLSCLVNLRVLRLQYTKLEDVSLVGKLKKLEMLDLSKTWIKRLPEEMRELTNLRSLDLSGNEKLGSIPRDVGKLKKLEMLDLSATSIERLPEEMRELTNLRSLDLSETWQLESIPRDVLSNLSRLEELKMEQSFGGWETIEMGGGSMARLAELSSLNRLTTLSLHVDNLICLSEDIPTFFENLKVFSIYAREETDDEWDSARSERFMSLTTTLDPISNWVKVLLERTYELRLYRCKGLKNLQELNACGFKNLKYLEIVECHEMDYPMSVVQGPSEFAFSGLQKLVIEKVELEAICNGALPNGFLEKLRFLKIKKCHKLIYVIPCDLLSRLQDLEELHVEDCDELKEIFQSEGLEEGHAMILPKLRRMKLENLPKLTTIWKVLQIPTTSATRLRQSNSCDVSTSFPTPLIYPNLTKLEISSCGSLNYLFPVKLARGLVQLQILRVHDCDEMEEIIVDEEEVDEEEDKKMFPQLWALELKGLPKLSSFYKRRLLFDWPSLEFLYVVKCQNLKRLPLGLQNAPTLSWICGESSEWFEGLEWEDENIKSRLQPLFEETRRM